MTGAAGEMVTVAEERMATALEYKLSTLSKPERIKLLLEQTAWQRLMDRRNAEPMGDGSIAPMMKNQRAEARLKNRFLELTVAEEIRQAFIAMRDAPVRIQNRTILLNHGELDFSIPADRWEEGMPKSETVGQLQIPFCRIVRNGKDAFWIGVIIPTNYGVVSSFGEGTESYLCIWRNGENTANSLIGKKVKIRDISISGDMVKVSFLNEAGRFHQKEFDCGIANPDPVKINHWTMN